MLAPCSVILELKVCCVIVLVVEEATRDADFLFNRSSIVHRIIQNGVDLVFLECTYKLTCIQGESVGIFAVLPK